MTYLEWAERHSLTFGFDSEQDGARLADWCQHFERWSFAPEELAAASEALARGGAPSWRPDHFAALRDAVLKARQPSLTAPPPEADDPRGTCRDCRGVGRLVVPAAGLKTAAGNVIRRGTIAVLCRCPLGRWYASCSTVKRNGEAVTMMTLDQYERVRPGWRGEVNEEREAQRLAAAAACDRLDEGLRKVLEMARKRRREPGEEG